MNHDPRSTDTLSGSTLVFDHDRAEHFLRAVLVAPMAVCQVDEAVREVLDGPRPVSRVSVEIGVDEGTLRRWVQLERRAGDPDAPAPAARGGDGASDAARIRELERELREARQEADFLKKY